MEDLRISDAEAAIRTYSNYNAAWCLWTDMERSPGDAQSQLPAFSQLHMSRRYDMNGVRQHLLRGDLTLKLIRHIRADENPDFAMIAALWLPVQAFYAVEGFCTAFLAAKTGTDNLPRNHTAFKRRAAEDIVGRLLPSPFSAMVRGGYKGFKYLKPEIVNIRDERVNIGSGHNLKRPNVTTRDAHIVQCLDTTRRRVVDANLDRERQNARRKRQNKRIRLGRDRQNQIAGNTAATTIFDYLYRVRIKSNYEDPTMYQVGTDDAVAVLEFVRDTRKLAEILCGFLAAALWEVSDSTNRQELNATIDMCELLGSIGSS